jgi:branched-chain amino acid transport system permease protein
VTSVSTARFWLSTGAAALLLVLGLRVVGNDYAWFAGYFVLQYVVLATAWNVLGGYAGFVNFGSAGFFAAGAYTAVALRNAFGFGLLPALPVGILVGALLGLGTGYLTLRLRGVYFSIATLSLAIVLHTLIVNWSFVGGSRGAYVVLPRDVWPFARYGEYLFVVMLTLAVLAVGLARGIERSRLGQGLAALRDDERAAEAAGVPTLRLKLEANAISGALMAAAGVPLPYYSGYLNPEAAFGLTCALNAMAMPLIGGTSHWIGPVIGAVLLASLQQAATVTISSSANLLIVGALLVGFVIVAPNGLIGLFRGRVRAA